jgi:hypothetical protein
MPSGWRWTALFDTMINYGEFYTCVQLIYDAGARLRVLDMLPQGDDDWILLGSFLDAGRVYEAYKLTGLEINKSKFFVSTTRDEFLRRYAQRGVGVRGYISRGIHSILWRSPNKDSEKGSAIEILENWLTLMRRGGDNDAIWPILVEDIKGATGLRDQDIFDWFSTPATLGGAGIKEVYWGSRWVGITEERLYPNYKIISAKGLENIAENAGIKLDDREIQSVGKNLVQPNRLYKSQGKDVKVREWINVNGWRPTELGKNMVTAAIWKKNFPNMLREVVIRRAFKNGIWDSVREKLDARCILSFERLKSQASRGVLNEWLLGGFSVTFGRSMHWSTDIIAGVNSWADYIVQGALATRKINMDKMRRALLWVEDAVRSYGWEKAMFPNRALQQVGVYIAN